MADYIETFHRAYQESVNAFLAKPLRDTLLRQSLLEHQVRAFVSTQFGAGFEYLGEGPPGISVEVASRRVEEIFLADAPATVRKLPTMFAIGGSETGLMYLTLEGGFPFRLTSQAASVRLVDVGFRVQPWERRVRLAEIFGDRTSKFWSAPNAAARGVRTAREEANLALLDVERSNRVGVSLSEYIRDFKTKTVLLLGDYHGAGAERLDAIGDALVRFGYIPILLKDVPDQPEQDEQQKVVAVGSVARFILIDDSSVSGHLVEFPIVQNNRWVTLVLRLAGSKGTFMTRGASVASNVVLEATYTAGTLDGELRRGIDWAEAKLHELEREFGGTYPWRAEVAEPTDQGNAAPPPR